VCSPGRRDDHVAGFCVERFLLDRPAHSARAHDDHVVLWWVRVHLLDLTDGMRDEVDLDVVEPNPLVFIGRADEAAAVALVADLTIDPPC
jgi:hypothetical protein